MQEDYELKGRWTLGARKAFSFVRGFIAQGLGPTESLRTLQEGGIGVRRTEFFRLYREMTGTPPAHTALQATPLERRLGPTAFIEWPGRLEARFEYAMRYTLQDPITGQRREEQFTLAHGEQLSKGTALRLGASKLREKYSEYEKWEVIDAEVSEARHRAGDVWAGPEEITF